ncbi:flap endonuclease GEN [Drosophila tropicalis]|uniref:flap endonuclease GEN n=1 Tax=Drosophila tropicalis TaxID=46794 RepID=UPI0035ABA208
MGVKELWSILTPHAERKPINELRGKKVAIDLAGWVCESLNVVDFFIHPRHHLKNLFFRTCYLIWEQVTPIFVLEGVAPKLKSQVIAKRNELQFRGVKPKDSGSSNKENTDKAKEKGRTRFNHVLKQCENLLISMGIQCVQGPGEAEAYCAFLNKHGLVDGVISQDSDCFAYGAVRVYRNFSVSTQGAQAAAGGAVDIYDMRDICSRMDFGQNKIIVMALLCGCDYCPDGIGGIGKDGVLKLFNKYTDAEILQRLRNWRNETSTYNALEIRVDDKSICSNCGHLGRTQSHTKSGCSVCRTNRGCDESLWKEQRLSIKAELTLRRKALLSADFPNEEVIAEFLTEPDSLPQLKLNWQQPNLVKFIKQIGHLLQWPEIYCFQKFFPVLTRWQVSQGRQGSASILEPVEILKKRTVKGIASLELKWRDTKGSLKGLIPDDQLSEFEMEHPKGLEELYQTVEPLDLLEKSYPELVATFLKSKEKPVKKSTRKKAIPGDDKPKKVSSQKKKLQQPSMEQFLQKDKENTPVKTNSAPLGVGQCSTPLTKFLDADLNSDDEEFDMSDIINGIVSNHRPVLTQHQGHLLHYELLNNDLSLRLEQLSLKNEVQESESNANLRTEPEDADDDELSLHLGQLSLRNEIKTTQKRDLSLGTEPESKRLDLDDSYDLLVKGDLKRVPHLLSKTPVGRFKMQHRISDRMPSSVESDANVSYFFNQSLEQADLFEQLMETSLGHHQQQEDEEEEEEEDDIVVISD